VEVKAREKLGQRFADADVVIYNDVVVRVHSRLPERSATLRYE
jgi:7,8-dihydro-6-hydroxymethylpterin-pyrophosphokinase